MTEKDVRIKILSELSDGQRSPSCLVKKLKISPERVREELSRLEEEGTIIKTREIRTEKRHYVFYARAGRKPKKF